MDADHDNTDLGRALDKLSDSMDELSYGMSGLTGAVQRLQDSTRRLSEQQADLSADMTKTARRFEGTDEGPSASVKDATEFGAAADD